MIRLRKISLLNDVRKNRTPLYYWSLGAGFVTTVSFITFAYFLTSYRIKQRTKEGIRKGEPERIISTEGLSSQELEKAIALFEQQKLHNQIQVDNFERYKRLRDKRREQEVSNEHVDRIVKSILNKRQRTIREQQQTFIRRNTEENKKRNNYLVDKFTMKKRTNSSKENIDSPTPKLISPKKKKPPFEFYDDDDDDFVSTNKRPKTVHLPQRDPPIPKIDPIQECLESIISEIENAEATCPICNQMLSNFPTIDQREQHVSHCLEQSQMQNVKHQKTLLSYPKFSSTIRKPTSTVNFKCQICGMSSNVKRTYLAHLKKCSAQNSVQLKHVVNFAAKTTTVVNEPKPVTTKKKTEMNIKSRVIKMEVPINEEEEQQQFAIALSASIKTATEPPNAFDILQAASKKTKTIDLSTTPLWNISSEEKLKLSSTRLLNLCERVINIVPPVNPYRFPPSSLYLISQTNFGYVDWWNITTTDPQNDEIPMTQLARILDENDDAPVI